MGDKYDQKIWEQLKDLEDLSYKDALKKIQRIENRFNVKVAYTFESDEDKTEESIHTIKALAFYMVN